MRFAGSDFACKERGRIILYCVKGLKSAGYDWNMRERVKVKSPESEDKRVFQNV
jgi:hypothetical protein